MKNALIALFVALSLGSAVSVAEARTINIQEAPNPHMRVLVGVAEEENQFTSDGFFVVRDTNGTVYYELDPEEVVSISYDGEVYQMVHDDEHLSSEYPIQVAPEKLRKTMEVVTFENRPAWNAELNDNFFYGTIEVVYSEQSDAVLLVNDLGIERYVRGIAEAGNQNDPDYLQALLTAARTYAWFNMNNPSKHDGEPYILDATANDQVYRGAGFTVRAPNIIAAQRATKKKVITYDGDIIIAPYFSQSDGRTRSWSEVWNGEYPWATSVEDPCCSTTALTGHGVGLSAAGARYFAEEGMSWKDILKYYYTGVEIVNGY